MNRSRARTADASASRTAHDIVPAAAFIAGEKILHYVQDASS